MRLQTSDLTPHASRLTPAPAVLVLDRSISRSICFESEYDFMEDQYEGNPDCASLIPAPAAQGEGDDREGTPSADC